MKNKKIILGILISLFILHTVLALTNQIEKIDTWIYQIIIGFRNNNLDLYFKTITKLGNTIVIVFIIILLIILLPKKQKKQVLFSSLATITVNLLVKNLLKRKRPNHLRLIKQGGYSYPSGHAMMSVAIYGYLLYLVVFYLKKKEIKYPTTILLILIIVSIGISRIYLGVHYPSDIIGGYLLVSIIEIIIMSNKYFRGNTSDKNDCQ